MNTPASDAVSWRFRRLTALYPTSWLVDHGEAYLGTMLDVADAEGRTRPSRRDWLAALRHLGGVWITDLRRRAQADAALRSLGFAGHAALVSGAALSLLALVLGEWGPGWILPGSPPSWWGRQVVEPSTGLALYPLWVMAFGLVVAGRPARARQTLRLAVVVPALLVVVHAAGGPDRPSAGVLLALTAFAVVASTVPEPGRGTRVVLVASVPMLAAAAAAWMLSVWASGAGRAFATPPLGLGFYRADGLPALAEPVFWAVVVAAAVALPLAVIRPGLLLAVGLVGTPWLWLALSTRMHLRPEEMLSRGAIGLGVTALPGLLVVLVATAFTARRLVVSR